MMTAEANRRAWRIALAIAAIWIAAAFLGILA